MLKFGGRIVQLKLGTYSFDTNACRVRQDSEIRYSNGDSPISLISRVHVVGYLAADGQSALTTAQQALEAKLEENFNDIVLLRDDGSESATVLKNTGSISGVMIRRYSFPGEDGAEYATLRKFEFDAEAEYPFSSRNNLVSWSEELSFSGGGPVYVHRPSINGPSQKQRVYPAMHYSCTQSGQAIGYRDFPIAPFPRWANDLKHSPEIRKFGPERKGTGYVNFGISWTYQYEGIREFVGVPTPWPLNS